MDKPLEIDEQEWQARCQLAALYRLIAYYKMTDLIDTHISLRLAHQPEYFLINKYGVTFDRMRASDLVKIDHEGNIVAHYDEGKMVNVAGFVIHSALHHARADINCVIHTHTADGIAVSAQTQGLLPLSQHALKFYQNIAYHEYEGIAFSTEERVRLVKDMAHYRCMILRNHGLLATGDTVARAFHEIYFLERACQIQIKALSSSSLHYPSPEVREHTLKQFESPQAEPIIMAAWNAALSLIEDQKADYCQ
ncbi:MULTISPECIES: class II aldolase/adducin family protein [Acinetobacter]|uniref:class II aldolase/adducin family protein n=1 Tax=Acinetobacter TaxID=469 RepID=UPI000EA07C19|nr:MULTISPECIES: class II aldolase/adducin family protein [Acinetobacter]RKG43082.1 class II aldolase/adducin family protein [Acinetobacter cumulans]RZG58940.1 class II aldolase/adducin family protein [Acinetobacter sp. WCHAc060006]